MGQRCSFGVSPTLVCAWKQGECVPNLETFELLCEILQLDSAEFGSHRFATMSKSRKNALTLWLEELGLWGKDAH